MTTKGSVALMVGVMMMMVVFIAETKVILPENDVSTGKSAPPGGKRWKADPELVKAWLLKKEEHLKAHLRHISDPDNPNDDDTLDDVTWDQDAVTQEQQPPSTATDDGKKPEADNTNPLTRKRRSPNYFNYRDDDSDEDDDDSDDDDDWGRRRFGGYHRSNYGRRTHGYGYPTVYSQSNRRLGYNRGRYGALGVPYGNTRYTNSRHTDDWRYQYGNGYDSDDDDSPYGYGNGYYGYDDSRDRDGHHGYRSRLQHLGNRYRHGTLRRHGGYRSRYQPRW